MTPPRPNPAAAVTASGMRALEKTAMDAGTAEAHLMERAGSHLGHAIARFFPHPGCAVAYAGKGHNGGDALIALRVLRDEYGWQIRLRPVIAKCDLAPLARAQLTAHRETPHFNPAEPIHRHPLVLLDGLLGIGADCSPLRGPLAQAAEEMRTLRESHGALVAAVDLPSGMQADTGAFPDNGVRADVTFTIGAVKCGLLETSAANATGSLALVPVAELTAAPGPGPAMICPQHPCAALAPRPYDFHKGMAGRVGILAGSEAYSGAAALCAGGALAGGAGLVTLFVPRAIHALVAARCAPEVIVRPFDNLSDIERDPAGAWIVGCGIGPDWGADLISFITAPSATPMVVDADALNALARLGGMENLGTNHLLTPHPGEFRRIAPDLATRPPREAAAAWARRSPATLLLKGCRTVIASQNSEPLVNATGHPGMGTGGQGDVLAGVAAALLAGGQPVPSAAALAAWLCGRAAERAIHHGGESAESLRASSVIAHLGGACHDWRRATR